MKWGALQKRLYAWLFVLTLLMTALPSGASWQCLNGTPCPPHCPQLQQASQPTQCRMASMPSCCGTSFALAATGGRSHIAGNCPLSRCVFQMQAKPTAILSPAAQVTLPLMALVPTAQRFPIRPSETVTVPVPPPLVFYQQRYLRPYAGRAPPIPL